MFYLLTAIVAVAIITIVLNSLSIAISCVGKLFNFALLLMLTLVVIYTFSFEKVYYRNNHTIGNYQQLTQLLQQKKWQLADEETQKQMLIVTNRQKKGYLSTRAMDTFPCDQLQQIDRLWSTASNNQFSFTMQSKLMDATEQEITNDDKYDISDLGQLFYKHIGWKISKDNQQRSFTNGANYPNPVGTYSPKACRQKSLDKFLFFGQGVACSQKIYTRLQECQ